MVDYHPISATDMPRLHQFLEDALNAVTIWKGDILIADIEELGEMDASEIHVRRLNSFEFSKSCEDLSWNHRASASHRSVTSAERAPRRI